MSEIKTMKGLPIEVTHELDETKEYWVLKPEYSVPYRASNKEQLANWVEGKPLHNDFSDECCPDFSCCRPDLLWPKDQREFYAQANPEVQQSMLVSMIPNVLSDPARKPTVH